MFYLAVDGAYCMGVSLSGTDVRTSEWRFLKCIYIFLNETEVNVFEWDRQVYL